MSVTAIHAFTGPLFGDGATVDFPFDFMVGSTAEVGVKIDGAEQSDSAFSVTLNANGTGTITFVTAPADGEEVLPFADPDFSQTVSFGNAGAFLPTSHDRVNDAAARRAIFLRDRMLASLRAPRGEALAELPSRADRAGKYQAFDAEGDPIASTGIGSDADLRTDLAAATGGQLVGYSASRSAKSKLDDLVSIKDFSPTGDGVADDRAAFVAAEAATAADTPILIPPGSYKIASNLTINRRLIFMGGTLVIPTGVTVNLYGGIEAGPQRVFTCTGTGKVVFAWDKTAQGYMEWWGAKADQSVDCYAAFMAATEALLDVKHMGGHYQFETTPRLIHHNRSLSGVGRRYRGGSEKEVTRYLINSGTQYGLRIGPDAEPATINDFQQGNCVRDIYVSRMVAPVIASNTISLRVQFTLDAIIERVKCAESMIEFDFYGTVATKAIDVEAARSVAGGGAGTDYWRGYHADGSADIGAAGGNASLYLIRPLWSCNIAALQTGDSRGFHADGDFTDIFLDFPEGVNCNDDVYVSGNGTTNLDTGNCDLRINHPTFDQFHNSGIYIASLAGAGIVEVTTPYFGPSADARACLWFNACSGQVTILGGELNMHSAPAVQGIIIDSSDNIQLLGTAIKEHGNTYPVIGMHDAVGCRIEPSIRNASATGQVAIQLSGTCTANRIAPMISGKASAFTKGIDVTGTADARNLYELSGIDSAALPAASKKLVRNGVDVAAVGTTGTNYVSGVVA